ncbi:kinase-like domain-containing protein [Ustulina deusta]|nr:kinase-like domain-containing protein [Ustulina deusta]
MTNDLVPQSPRDLPADDSQEATQAFPPGYVEARLETSPRVAQPSETLDWSKLNQDPKPSQLEGARVLLYPKVKGFHVTPYNGTRQFGPWVDVKMDRKPGSARVLVIAPGSEEIGCTTRYLDAFCCFFFDPANDSVVFSNHSLRPFSAGKFGREMVYPVLPSEAVSLSVGIWDLTFDGESLVEVQVLNRENWLTTHSSPVKRVASTDENPSKRIRVSDDRVARLTKSPPVVPNNNALAKLEKGMKILVGSPEQGYWLTHLGTIFENEQSAIWRANHSSDPIRDIVVKVVKTIGREKKSVVRAAKRCVHEYTIHASFNHPSIVKLLGMDARFHSLYLEHVDARALSRQVDPGSYFIGTQADALRIMADLASALSHIHSKEIVHGDIKPANVLYNNSRGAVLIDFGLSFRVGNSVASRGCGTPWYLPPEYIRDRRLGGPEADIWDLGVTMLWLLRRITLPERLHEGWRIADINPEGTSSESHELAMGKMNEWLKIIKRARVEFLSQEDTELGHIVGKALEPNDEVRINAASLSEQLGRLKLMAPRDENTGHCDDADKCLTQN